MSLTDQLTSITRNYIQPKMYDNIFDSNPLLAKFKSSGRYVSQNGGTTIDIPLNYAQTSSSGWFSGSDTLTTADNENITRASYNWKSAYAAITVAEEDKLKNAGELGVIKLLASKAMIAEKTLDDRIGTGLLSDGTTAKSIVGLRDIVATDQTVGGISQSTSSWWASNVDSTTTTLSISAMNTQFQNATIGADSPDMCVTTRAVYNLFYNLLQPQQRFLDKDMAKAGFTSLMFNSAPIVIDSHCPASHLFMLNMKYLGLYYHPERNMSATEYQKPINQEVLTSRILWMGSLTSSNNRMHALLSGITA